MTKCHLLSRDEPIGLGVTVQANCGATVTNAVACTVMSVVYICDECRVSDLEGRYLYGLIPGDERQ